MVSSASIFVDITISITCLSDDDFTILYDSISVLVFSHLTFDDVSRAVMVIPCRHVCENRRIFMKSVEFDRGSGLIALNAHLMHINIYIVLFI